MVDNSKQDNSNCINNNSLLLLKRDCVSIISSNDNSITKSNINKRYQSTISNLCPNDMNRRNSDMMIRLRKAFSNKEKALFNTKVKFEYKNKRYSMFIPNKEKGIVNVTVIDSIKHLKFLESSNNDSKLVLNENSNKKRVYKVKTLNDNHSMASSSLELFQKQLCPICLYAYNTKNKEIVLLCKHSFCKKCIKGYYEDQIENGFYNLKCPLGKCAQSIGNINFLHAILSHNLYERLSTHSSSQNESQQGNDDININDRRIFCPKCGHCGYFFCKRNRCFYKCLYCMVSICRYCGEIRTKGHLTVCKGGRRRTKVHHNKNIVIREMNCFLKGLIYILFFILFQSALFIMTYLASMHYIKCGRIQCKAVKVMLHILYIVVAVIVFIFLLLIFPYFPLLYVIINFIFYIIYFNGRVH